MDWIHIHITVMRQGLYMLSDSIGYIRFDNFYETTYNEVVETIKEMKSRGMRSLILDLSNNFGGLAQSVRQLAGEFPPAKEIP